MAGSPLRYINRRVQAQSFERFGIHSSASFYYILGMFVAELQSVGAMHQILLDSRAAASLE
jgi:hypothetical protein